MDQKEFDEYPVFGTVGMIPSCDRLPMGGFNPQIPLASAQAMMENEVSVPTAMGTIPAETATPDPEDDPDGDRCGSTA